MIGEEKVNIQKPQGYHCFACGTANPIGLNLQFYRFGDAVYSDITLGKNHVGWENVAHGGIVSTLLDEVMSWTIMYFKKIFLVTRKMEVKYIRPVLIGTPLIIRGEVMDDSRPPRIKARADIRDNESNLLVRSLGEFVELPMEKLSSVPEGLKEEMLSLFENFE
jgi:acyl-coenzyme A thioesterase PaaI-like protein